MTLLGRVAAPLRGTAGGDRQAAGALLALVAATAAFAFQQLAVLPALPDVQADLDASDTYVAWLLSVYLVVASVTAPFFGALADRRGGRPVLLGALVVFLVGSVGAALAPSLPLLVLARALQGVGGVVFPLSFAIARDVLPDRNTSAGLGSLTVAFGVGTGLGLAGGGVLVALMGWRGVFVAGAVAVAAATALCWRLVPSSPPQGQRGLDLPGALLLAGGLGALLLALTEGPSRGLGPVVGLLVVGGAALLLAFRARERSTPDPLLDLTVLRERDVVLVNVAALLAGYALFGAVYLAPFALAEDAGPLVTGLVLAPTAAGQVLAGRVVARLDSALRRQPDVRRWARDVRGRAGAAGGARAVAGGRRGRARRARARLRRRGRVEQRAAHAHHPGRRDGCDARHQQRRPAPRWVRRQPGRGRARRAARRLQRGAGGDGRRGRRGRPRDGARPGGPGSADARTRHAGPQTFSASPPRRGGLDRSRRRPGTPRSPRATRWTSRPVQSARRRRKSPPPRLSSRCAAACSGTP